MLDQTAIASSGVTGLGDLIIAPPYLRHGATAFPPPSARSGAHSLRAGFLTSAAGTAPQCSRCGMSADTRAWTCRSVRDADLFRDHAGSGCCLEFAALSARVVLP